jgi:beta-xylosidase
MRSDNQPTIPFEAWRDTSRTPAERAELLLKAMTPRERLRQLGSSWPGSESLEEAVAPLQESHLLAESFEDAIADGLGHITRPFGTAPVDPREGIDRLGALQRQVMNANRFGIPAIAHEECLTGLTAWKATVFPTPLAWAATFDPDLVQQMGAVIGEGMAALGVHQGLAPVLDVVRDYRWGRVEETLGEDPHLVAAMSAGYVKGLQSAGVLATLKHFVGYSASRGARNHAPVSIGVRELHDVMLLPFERAVVEAGARSVMNSYTELDGVPTASDRYLLTEILRDGWGFDGTIVSDYWAIGFLSTMHRLVDDFSEAAVLALRAGIDVELPHTLAYSDALLGLAQSELIDQSAMRVLRQKAELGLLDPDWAPPMPSDVDLDSPGSRDLARRLAEASVIVLANADDVLPLDISQYRKIAVIGPIADDPQSLFGCYSFPNHVLPNFPESGLGVTAPTVLEGLRAEFPTAEIEHVPGVDVVEPGIDGIEDAVRAAESADVTILVVGDRSGMFGHGTSGEGCDVLTLDLPGDQERLVDAVLGAASPVILVVVSGRPYAIGRHAERAAAAVQAFLPGQAGAGAIAGVLSSRVEPSGRLPVQIPGKGSAQPGTYLAPPLALRSDGISNIDPSPAFPFGYGLAYTTFEIDAPTASATHIPTDGEVVITATVRNTGARAGTCVPQLYLTDPQAEVTRPVRQLIGFTRVRLEPGEAAEVAFRVHADLAAYTDRSLRKRVDSGRIILAVDTDANGTRSGIAVSLTGETRFVDHTRRMTVPVSAEVLVLVDGAA